MKNRVPNVADPPWRSRGGGGGPRRQIRTLHFLRCVVNFGLPSASLRVTRGGSKAWSNDMAAYWVLFGTKVVDEFSHQSKTASPDGTGHVYAGPERNSDAGVVLPWNRLRWGRPLSRSWRVANMSCARPSKRWRTSSCDDLSTLILLRRVG